MGLLHRICAKRRIPFLPIFIEALERHEYLHLTEECCRQLLCAGSRRTLHRLGYRFQGSQPQALRTNVASWDGCIVRALEEETYRDLLRDAGFTDIEVEVTRRYSLADIGGNGAGASIDALSPQERPEVDARFVSAFIRVRKP